jgi:hypothetical protein
MIDQDQDKTFNKQDLMLIVGFWRKNNRQTIDRNMKTDESLI